MIDKLIRPDLRKFKSYTPSLTLKQISSEIGLPVEKIIKLDTGENPYVERLQSKNLLKNMDFYPYPDPYCTSLRNKLSPYTGYSPSWLICGNGSDELIDLLIRTFVLPKEEIIVAPPTFPMYEFFGRLSKAEVRYVWRKKDLTINIPKIIKSISSKTKIVFIDSPGNPAGTLVTYNQLKNLLAKKIIVVVDEAYYEYCQRTVLPLVRTYPNLVVLRTFSKWAGLAGLRIGYLVANPKIVKIISSIKPPYNVNSAAQIMACSVLDHKVNFLTAIRKVVVLRSLLIKKLSQISSIKVFPSFGPYVVFKTKSKTKELMQYLGKNGVLLKLINQPLVNNCLRVNLGRKREIKKLVSLIEKYYGK